ncbi:MAG: hypothetical protein ACYTGN_17465 [Planctomycetota bacterium]|jgi:hypothetical protein
MARRKQFMVGSVLSTSFSVWTRNIIPFTLMVAVVESPMILYAYLQVTGAIEVDLMAFVLSFATGVALLGLVATGALTYGVFQQLSGKPAGIGDSVSVGFSRLLPVLGVGISVFAIVFVLGLVGFGLLVLIAGDGGLVVLLAIPLLIFIASILCKYYVAVPIAVVERPGVIASLRRSAELTKGSRLSIFAVWFVIQMLERFASKIIENVDQSGWILIAFGIVWVGLTSTTSAVVYHDLRVSKEGVGIDELTSVFS